MTRITTTNQKKNTTIAGIAYPPTVLALATSRSYPAPPGLSATGVNSATAGMLISLFGERGFRSVAWEEDWATGQRIDRYIRGGAGDADALVGQMLAQWHSPKVAGVLRWLRAYNAGRSDKVRFVGVEYYLTGQPAYDAVAAYVGAVQCQVGDVQRLELGDEAVDGVRTERVLMYVPDQQRAIGELARVVRPGGRIVAFELDYGATLVDLPDRGAAQRVLEALGYTVAHRWMGRALARAFHQAGLATSR
jgi:SAM-dependent methyltransferase